MGIFLFGFVSTCGAHLHFSLRSPSLRDDDNMCVFYTILCSTFRVPALEPLPAEPTTRGIGDMYHGSLFIVPCGRRRRAWCRALYFSFSGETASKQCSGRSGSLRTRTRLYMRSRLYNGRGDDWRKYRSHHGGGRRRPPPGRSTVVSYGRRNRARQDAP